MNLWSEPGDALFGPKRPTLEKFKDLKDDAVKKGNDIASLSPDMMAKTETEKYLELFKNQRMWLSALAEKYPDPGMMAKPHGFEVGDRAYGGADTLNDRQGYFMFPGHPMYWVTERSGKSKLGVASPPASWWLQREGAQKFWEWLRPMGQSADRNGAVRGPKLQFVVGQAAMTGYGKWWPDMPSSEMDLNRHRGWYSTQWVRSTQPSNFLEIAGPAGASDGAGAGGDHGVGGASRRGSFRRRLSIAKRLPSRRTSFHAFKFFHNRDNTNRPYAPEPAKYLKPNTDWNSTGLNGNNSEKNDPEMREGDQNKFEKKFLEYRNPCLTGHVRSKASVECAKNDMQKRYLNGPDEEAFMDPKEYKDMKEEQQGIKKKGLVAKAMGGLKALAAMGIPKDPPITQSDFFRRYSMRRPRALEPTMPVLDDEIYSAYADEWNKPTTGIPTDTKSVNKVARTKMLQVQDKAKDAMGEIVSMVKQYIGNYKPQRDYYDDVTPPIEEATTDPGILPRVDTRYQSVQEKALNDQAVQDGLPLSGAVTIDPDLFNKVDVTPNGEISGPSRIPRNVQQMIAVRWAPFGTATERINAYMSIPPGADPKKAPTTPEGLEQKTKEASAVGTPPDEANTDEGDGTETDAANGGGEPGANSATPAADEDGGAAAAASAAAPAGGEPEPAPGADEGEAGTSSAAPAATPTNAAGEGGAEAASGAAAADGVDPVIAACGERPPKRDKRNTREWEICAAQADTKSIRAQGEADEAARQNAKAKEAIVEKKHEAEFNAMQEAGETEDFGSLELPSEDAVEQEIAHIENEMTGGPEYSMPQFKLTEEKKAELAVSRARQVQALKRLFPEEKAKNMKEMPQGFEMDAILAQRRDALVMDEKYLKNSHVDDNETNLGKIAKKLSDATHPGDQSSEFLVTGMNAANNGNEDSKAPDTNPLGLDLAGASTNSKKQQEDEESLGDAAAPSVGGGTLSANKQEIQSWADFWGKLGFDRGEEVVRQLWSVWAPFQRNGAIVGEIAARVHWPREGSYDDANSVAGSMLVNKFRKRLERSLGSTRPSIEKYKLSEVL